ncbi:unnamed protein product [Camellia sinensis]
MKKGYLLGFRNHNSQEVLIERRFVLGFCWKENSYKEQIEAKNLFSSEEDEEQAKKEFAKTFVPGEAPSIPEDPKEEQAPKPVAPTPEQIITIKVAIVNSQTLEEVARLEKILKLVIMMPRPTLKQPKKTTVTDEENEANDGPSDAEPEQKNESADMEQVIGLDCFEQLH